MFALFSFIKVINTVVAASTPVCACYDDQVWNPDLTLHCLITLHNPLFHRIVRTYVKRLAWQMTASAFVTYLLFTAAIQVTLSLSSQANNVPPAYSYFTRGHQTDDNCPWRAGNWHDGNLAQEAINGTDHVCSSQHEETSSDWCFWQQKHIETGSIC